MSRRTKYALLDTCPHCGHYLLDCRVPHCEKPLFAAGLCSGHYARKAKYGNVIAEVPLGRSGLTVELRDALVLRGLITAPTPKLASVVRRANRHARKAA